jgi:transposase
MNDLLTPRYAWILANQSGEKISVLARRFGISRKTFYKWKKRYEKSGGDTHVLLDHTRKPLRLPRILSESKVLLIYSIKDANPEWGPIKISRKLLQEYGVYVSERTIWKWLKKRSDGIPYPILPADNFELRPRTRSKAETKKVVGILNDLA